MFLKLKKCPTISHRWWIHFQYLCIIFQIYFLFQIFTILDDRREEFKVTIFLFTLIDVSIICSVLISFSCWIKILPNQIEPSSTVNQQFNDLPPSYEQATQNILSTL